MRKLKIVLCGAESSGKTSTAKFLAGKFATVWLPEFARLYIENLNRKYTYEDVVLIAQRQIEREKKFLAEANKILFVDTSLINLKVWFSEVFGKYPYWLEEQILQNKADFFLLMNNDLPWIYDKVRENPGERRHYLFERYRQEIEYYGFEYQIVSGTGQARFENALKIVLDFLKKKHYF